MKWFAQGSDVELRSLPLTPSLTFTHFKSNTWLFPHCWAFLCFSPLPCASWVLCLFVPGMGAEVAQAGSTEVLESRGNSVFPASQKPGPRTVPSSWGSSTEAGEWVGVSIMWSVFSLYLFPCFPPPLGEWTCFQEEGAELSPCYSSLLSPFSWPQPCGPQSRYTFWKTYMSHIQKAEERTPLVLMLSGCWSVAPCLKQTLWKWLFPVEMTVWCVSSPERHGIWDLEWSSRSSRWLPHPLEDPILQNPWGHCSLPIHLHPRDDPFKKSHHLTFLSRCSLSPFLPIKGLE